MTIEVQSVLARAWGWVNDRLDLFDFTIGANLADRVQLLKPFSELLLVCAAVPPGLRPAGLGDECWRLAGKNDFVLDILRARPDILELGAIFAAFHRLGYPVGHFAEELANLLGSRREWASHLPPWRRFAILHSLDELNIKAWPEALPQDSFLAERPPPWVICDELAYAFTHEIFYCTNFGREDRWISKNIKDYIRFSVPLWLRIFIQKKNFDLVSEILACASYLGLSVGKSAVPVLIAHQSPDGSFAGPEGAGSGLPYSFSARAADFSRRYHTTLVALMALSASAESQT